jgi:hypothetical protein
MLRVPLRRIGPAVVASSPDPAQGDEVSARRGLNTGPGTRRRSERPGRTCRRASGNPLATWRPQRMYRRWGGLPAHGTARGTGVPPRTCPQHLTQLRCQSSRWRPARVGRPRRPSRLVLSQRWRTFVSVCLAGCGHDRGSSLGPRHFRRGGYQQGRSFLCPSSLAGTLSVRTPIGSASGFRMVRRSNSSTHPTASRRNGLGRSTRSSSISICRTKRTTRRARSTPRGSHRRHGGRRSALGRSDPWLGQPRDRRASRH